MSWCAREPQWNDRKARVFDTSGGEVFAREYGGRNDRLGVLLHGLGGSSDHWYDVALHMGGCARVLAIDIPGFGRSSPPRDGDYSIASAAVALCEVIQQVRGGPVHLVGHSFGAVIAVDIAGAFPEMVDTLSLISPAMPDYRPQPRRLADPKLALAVFPFMRQWRLRQLESLSHAERARRMIDLCFANPGKLDQDRLKAFVEEMEARGLQDWSEEALWRSGRALVSRWLWGPSLWSVAAKLHVPCLVICGVSDRLISPRVARKTANVVPNATFVTIEECGHVPHLEHPAVVARAIERLWTGGYDHQQRDVAVERD